MKRIITIATVIVAFIAASGANAATRPCAVQLTENGPVYGGFGTFTDKMAICHVDVEPAPNSTVVVKFPGFIGDILVITKSGRAILAFHYHV